LAAVFELIEKFTKNICFDKWLSPSHWDISITENSANLRYVGLPAEKVSLKLGQESGAWKCNILILWHEKVNVGLSSLIWFTTVATSTS